ncbi:MAG: pseudouridine-5'-phosphate glycosidase [Phycisphaerales bacterium]|nr:pseudouridine-5'-phosphate glycosidase [Phycisphaerales bacterium]
MSITVSSDVAKALDEGRPVVALETAVLTCGLPRQPWQDRFGEAPSYVGHETPINQAAAAAMTAAVNRGGCVAAWIAIVDGVLRIGLAPDELVALAANMDASKVSLATIAAAMRAGASAGTTVATTLLACGRAETPIRAFATGGIGGLHRDWARHLDISADLAALATNPVCVVASGCKSILDISATVEAIESIGVPVVGMGTDWFPRFVEANSVDDPGISRLDDPSAIAELCRVHWDELGQRSAVLVTKPVPADTAIARGSLEGVIEAAERSWRDSGDPGYSRTPVLLTALAEATQGLSLRANLTLLIENAAAAARIACDGLYSPSRDQGQRGSGT